MSATKVRCPECGVIFHTSSHKLGNNHTCPECNCRFVFRKYGSPVVIVGSVFVLLAIGMGAFFGMQSYLANNTNQIAEQDIVQPETAVIESSNPDGQVKSPQEWVSNPAENSENRQPPRVLEVLAVAQLETETTPTENTEATTNPDTSPPLTEAQIRAAKTAEVLKGSVFSTLRDIKEIDDALRVFQQGNALGALNLITKADEKTKLPVSKHYLMAELFLLARRAPDALGQLELAIRETEYDPHVHFLLGNIALTQGRFSDARLQFEVARKYLAKEKDPERLSQLQINTLAGLSRIEELREHWAEAIVLLSQVIEISVDNENNYLRLAQFQIQIKAYSAAEETVKKFIQARGEKAELEVIMSNLLLQAGQVKESRKWIMQFSESHQDDLRRMKYTAKWMLENGSLEEAIAYIRHAKTLSEDDPELLYFTALVARIKKEHVEAEKILQSLYVKLPGNFKVACHYALALASQRDSSKLAQARKIAEDTVSRFPKLAEAYSTLGWVYFKLGLLDDSEKAFKRAISSGRIQSDTAYYYASLLYEKNRLDEAKRFLETSINTPGLFIHREDAKIWFKSLTSKPE